MNNEDEEETEQLRASMATSLKESEAAKAAAAAAAPSHPEDLSDEYPNSAILTSLSGLACVNLLLSPACLLRAALVALLKWEKNCGRWYKGPGTKAYFDSLALECCACLQDHFRASVHPESAALLATSGSSAPVSLNVWPPVTSAGAAAAAREAAARAAASVAAAAVAGAGASSSHQAFGLHPSQAASSTSSLAQALQAPTALLLRCCPGGCKVCAPPLTACLPASHLTPANAVQTTSTLTAVASASPPPHPFLLQPPHLAHLAYSNPATTTTSATANAAHASSSAAPAAVALPQSQARSAPQVAAMLAALRGVCMARASEIESSVSKMPETANAVPKIFFQNMPAVSNADSDVVMLDDTDGEVQGRNSAVADGRIQPASRSTAVGRMSRPVPDVVMEVE